MWDSQEPLSLTAPATSLSAHFVWTQSIIVDPCYLFSHTMEVWQLLTGRHVFQGGYIDIISHVQDLSSTCEAGQEPHLYAEGPHCSSVCFEDSLICMHAMPQIYPRVWHACMPNTQEVSHCSCSAVPRTCDILHCSYKALKEDLHLHAGKCQS